jgi:hypothetical protein
VFGVVVELTLVVHDHIKVAFKEGGRSWWICYISFAGSLARPGASVIVVFSVEVMHYRILSVNQFVDVEFHHFSSVFWRGGEYCQDDCRSPSSWS